MWTRAIEPSNHFMHDEAADTHPKDDDGDQPGHHADHPLRPGPVPFLGLGVGRALGRIAGLCRRRRRCGHSDDGRAPLPPTG